jgi:hypothetical protein
MLNQLKNSMHVVSSDTGLAKSDTKMICLLVFSKVFKFFLLKTMPRQGEIPFLFLLLPLEVSLI